MSTYLSTKGEKRKANINIDTVASHILSMGLFIICQKKLSDFIEEPKYVNHDFLGATEAALK